jgi:hypothetical protein
MLMRLKKKVVSFLPSWKTWSNMEYIQDLGLETSLEDTTHKDEGTEMWVLKRLI